MELPQVTLEAPLKEGEVHCQMVGDKPVAIWNVGGEHFAAEDFCPHRGGPLSEGILEGACIVCPWHGAKFDLRTGDVVSGPAKRGLKRLNVEVPPSV